MNTIQESVFTSVVTATTTYNVEKAGYSEGEKFSEWAFDDARAVGNIEIYYQYDGAATEAKMGEDGAIAVDSIDASNLQKYSYITVYHLTKTHEKDTEKSRDFSYIVFADETKATAAVETIKAAMAAGGFTKDVFTAEGDKLVTDGTATFVNTVENYEKGNFGSDDLDEWLYADETAANSLMAAPVKITDSESSSTVYVVAFYIGEGDELWYLDVKSSVYSDLSEKKDAELKATFEVKVNSGMLENLWYNPIKVKVIGD